MENIEITPVKVRTSPLPFVIIALLLVLGIISGLFIVLSGEKNLTYRQAERQAILNAGSSFIQVRNETPYNATDVEVKLTPGTFLETILMTSLNPTVFKESVVVDGVNVYVDMANLNGTKEIFSLLLLERDGQTLIGMPAFTDILFDFTKSVRGALETYGENQPATDTVLDYTALYGTADDILEAFFDLTEEEAREKNVNVSLGDISKNSDIYRITIDNEVLRKTLIIALENMLLNENLTDWLSEITDVQVIPYFNDALAELQDKEKFDASAGDTEFLVTMDAYVSGNKIVKRDFTAEEFKISFTDLNDGGKYARRLAVSNASLQEVFVLENLGDGGAGTVNIEVGENEIDKFTAAIEYEDFGSLPNGLPNNTLKINVPQYQISSNITTSSENDTTRSLIDLTLNGIKVFEIESSAVFYKDKAIPVLSGKVISESDPEFDAEAKSLIDKLKEAYSDITSLADENGNYDLIGYFISSSMASSAGIDALGTYSSILGDML